MTASLTNIDCCLLLLQARIAELEDELEQERSGRVKVTSSFNNTLHLI